MTEQKQKQRLEEVEPGLTRAEFQEKTLRHRFCKMKLAYGDPNPCDDPCGTQFCEQGGCRFSDG